MSRTNAEAPSHFPHWVALGSLAFVLWLFFANTVPALRERQELLDHASSLRDLRASYDAAIQEARLGVGPNAHYDLQALLVAIDQRGFTPVELCIAYPERPSTPANVEDHREPATTPDEPR